MKNLSVKFVILTAQVCFGVSLSHDIAWAQTNDEPTTRMQRLDQEEFKRLHRELVPQHETWATIPWHSNLLSAQRMAVKQKKPIFIWAMDGHPLGCT